MIFKKLLIIFLIALGLYGCNCDEKITKIDYIKIKDLQDKKSYIGIIKAQNSAILSFQTEGKISYLPFSKGDFIKKGQTIAKLDGILYVIRKNEEQARLHELIIKQNKQKTYYNRLDILHKEGAISDNDWESAYFELQELNQEIKVQKEKINYLDKELSYNSIIAPYDGYISQKFATANTFAKIGTPIVNFISSDSFEGEFYINENEINNFKPNKPTITEIQNKTYSGNITHISKTSLNTGGYLVKVLINNPSKELREGMSAIFNFELNEKTAIIPISCVFSENDKNFVYKIYDVENNIGNIKKVQIKIGKIINNEVEILKGIKKDDLIVLNHYDINAINQKVKL